MAHPTGHWTGSGEDAFLFKCEHLDNTLRGRRLTASQAEAYHRAVSQLFASVQAATLVEPTVGDIKATMVKGLANLMDTVRGL